MDHGYTHQVLINFPTADVYRRQRRQRYYYITFFQSAAQTATFECIKNLLSLSPSTISIIYSFFFFHLLNLLNY